jgi:hypothetical protein
MGVRLSGERGQGLAVVANARSGFCIARILHQLASILGGLRRWKPPVGMPFTRPDQGRTGDVGWLSMSRPPTIGTHATFPAALEIRTAPRYDTVI